jgi:glycerophosphoryl diester phosphodiesterase
MIKFYWRINRNRFRLGFGFRQIIQAKFIHPHFHLLTKENTRKCRKGLQVFPWTINELEDIKKNKKHRNGIITDFPNRI